MSGLEPGRSLYRNGRGGKEAFCDSWIVTVTTMYFPLMLLCNRRKVVQTPLNNGSLFSQWLATLSHIGTIAMKIRC